MLQHSLNLVTRMAISGIINLKANPLSQLEHSYGCFWLMDVGLSAWDQTIQALDLGFRPGKGPPVMGIWPCRYRMKPSLPFTPRYETWPYALNVILQCGNEPSRHGKLQAIMEYALHIWTQYLRAWNLSFHLRNLVFQTWTEVLQPCNWPLYHGATLHAWNLTQ